jgi:GLPGLI family protein
MKSFLNKAILLFFIVLSTSTINAQDFQGQAFYFSKTTMDMSRFNRGGQMSEAQKKQMGARMKPWLEKTYILTINKVESIFKEDEKLEGGPGGRAPSVWGSSFSAGPQYKNIKEKIFLQDQEFFGKQFLIEEEMKPLAWKMGSETKQIGQYTCFKATAMRPASEVRFNRTDRKKDEKKKKEGDDAEVANAKADTTNTTDAEVEEEKEEIIEVTAWYTLSIPVSQGPTEYWGLPGLILELSAGNVTMLCNKIVLNPEEKIEIKRPTKGQKVTKKEYNEIITGKMEEMRENRGRGGSGRGRGF